MEAHPWPNQALTTFFAIPMVKFYPVWMVLTCLLACLGDAFELHPAFTWLDRVNAVCVIAWLSYHTHVFGQWFWWPVGMAACAVWGAGSYAWRRGDFGNGTRLHDTWHVLGFIVLTVSALYAAV